MPVAYLDGPGGTQAPKSVIDAMRAVLTEGVSNLGGDFGASQLAEETTRRGREAMADFFNADPREISFGQNMTSITFAVSRALARSWGPGDAIVVTSLDHDANFTPWVRAAEDAGAEVRIAHFDVATGELDPAVVADLLDDRVRLVAACVASNAIGTLVDVKALTTLAHEAGAMVYLDSVHAGPHHLVDVQSIDSDFLVASAYKFFGPHTEFSTANSIGWPRSSSTRSGPLPRTRPTSWRRAPRASNRSQGWRPRWNISPGSAPATADDRDWRTVTGESGTTSALCPPGSSRA
jgi:selenocysteine lyase/cysteine desulfurase